jgi:hypothetical protein
MGLTEEVGRREVADAADVAPVVVDEGGWVQQLEGDPGVRRRRSIEGKSSSKGRSPEGGERRRCSDGVRRGGGAPVVQNRRGGCLGDGDERAALGHGRVRQNGARGRRIRPTGGGVPFLKGPMEGGIGEGGRATW